MQHVNLTLDEVALLKQFSIMKTDNRSRYNRLAVEIIPQSAFLSLYFITGHILYCFALIFALVLFNVVRVVKQWRSIELLRSIAEKVLAQPVGSENQHEKPLQH